MLRQHELAMRLEGTGDYGTRAERELHEMSDSFVKFKFWKTNLKL